MKGGKSQMFFLFYCSTVLFYCSAVLVLHYVFFLLQTSVERRIISSHFRSRMGILVRLFILTLHFLSFVFVFSHRFLATVYRDRIRNGFIVSF